MTFHDFPASRPKSINFQAWKKLNFTFHDFPKSVCTLTDLSRNWHISHTGPRESSSQFWLFYAFVFQLAARIDRRVAY